MQTDPVRVHFEPIGKRVDMSAGATLMDAARRAGIGLSSTCGGEGTCGRCRVVVMAGDVQAPTDTDRRFLSQAEIDAGQRLACRAIVQCSTRVYVPRASLVGDQRLALNGPTPDIAPDSAVRAVELDVAAPSLADPRSDFRRVAGAAEKAHGLRHLDADPTVVSQLTPLARRTGWRLTAFVRRHDVVGFAAPGRRPIGFAVDLGTTKIAAYLVDLVSGEELAVGGLMNPQIAYGEDVISRLGYADHTPGGANELATVVRGAIDGLVGSLADNVGVAREQVVDGCVVGNTAMHHLYLGLPTRQLAVAPFVAASSAPMDVRSRDLGLSIAPDARVHIPACIAGFVGADHVAMILGANLDRTAGVTIGLDIGTNTEIVVRRPARPSLASTSCASGPAFEGAHIRDGMRAAPGAIEYIRLGPSAADTMLRTVDDAPPVGICGSGIVDAMAELHRTARMTDRGRLTAAAPGIRDGENGLEFVLAPASVTGTGRDIVVTQDDVHEIQLAKGAIAAGIEMLLRATATDPGEVEEVVVAGAFGTYLNLDSALAIGLLPRLPHASYRQVGNAAGSGARAVLLSLRERTRARAIARSTTYVELTTQPGFQRQFAHSMHFGATAARGNQSDVPDHR
jgi:uncharacterized 2Fe-2S/4Fe-4S cluster protein (DUF4445 family)